MPDLKNNSIPTEGITTGQQLYTERWAENVAKYTLEIVDEKMTPWQNDVKGLKEDIKTIMRSQDEMSGGLKTLKVIMYIFAILSSIKIILEALPK